MVFGSGVGIATADVVIYGYELSSYEKDGVIHKGANLITSIGNCWCSDTELIKLLSSSAGFSADNPFTCSLRLRPSRSGGNTCYFSFTV